MWGHVLDKPIKFLIDTGSSVSVISKVWFGDINKLSKSKEIIYLANGESITTLGRVSVGIKFGNAEFKHSVLVADIQIEAILGTDFLTQYKCQLDFEKDCLRIQNDYFSMVENESCSNKVTAQDKTLTKSLTNNKVHIHVRNNGMSVLPFSPFDQSSVMSEMKTLVNDEVLRHEPLPRKTVEVANAETSFKRSSASSVFMYGFSLIINVFSWLAMFIVGRKSRHVECKKLFDKKDCLMGLTNSQLQEYQEKDKSMALVFALLKEGKPRPLWDDICNMSSAVKGLWNEWDKLRIHKGVLYRKWERNKGKVKWQLVVPTVLTDCHLNSLSCRKTDRDPSIKASIAKVKESCYWYRMKYDIRKWVHEVDCL